MTCGDHPCLNGGSCYPDILRLLAGFQCVCDIRHQGETCAIVIPCNSTTCANGGTCKNTEAGFACQCTSTYEGDRCEQVVKCNSKTCANGGTCTNTNQGFVCRCASGYVGETCRQVIKCNPSTCANGGSCVNSPTVFFCRCTHGYQGETCDDVVRCNATICANGGTCVNTNSGFRCHCTATYRGRTCKQVIKCNAATCSNGGSCTDTKDGFICRCTDRYQGSTCSEVIKCNSTICANGGICKDTKAGYVCYCYNKRYHGRTCTQLVKCKAKTCAHGGTCEDTKTGFVCRCTRGYEGDTCIQVIKCNSTRCANGGTCMNTKTGFSCRCTSKYFGMMCRQVIKCQSTTCANGGSCKDTDAGFICRCTDAYEGETCKQVIKCNSTTCKNGGSCEDTKTGFTCLCARGYIGKTCTKVISANNCTTNYCQNDGVCASEGTHFECQCPIAFRGDRCQLDGTNLALSKTTYQNSTLRQGVSSRAVDGDTNGYFWKKTCTLTEDTDPWWIIDLGENYLIAEVHISNRADCCAKRLMNFDVKVGLQYRNENFYVDTADHDTCARNVSEIALGTTARIACAVNVAGRFVSVVLNAKDRLSLCEVKVFGRAIVTCRDVTCNNGGTCYDRPNGFICNCTASYQGVTCDQDCLCMATGLDYAGEMSHSANGHTCRQWSHVRRATGLDSNDFLHDESIDEARNYCRNPLGAQQTAPYCFDSQMNTNVCDIPRCDPCFSDPCLNRATCVLVNRNLFICDCAHGFSGPLCNSRACEVNPCKNGGKCSEDSSGKFSCECNSRTYGPTCSSVCQMQPNCSRCVQDRRRCDPEKCYKGFFYEQYTGNCIPCEQPNCMRCRDSIELCDEGSCDKGYLRMEDGVCINCPFRCEFCVNKRKCQPGGCVPGYGLHNGRMCEACLVPGCKKCDGDISMCEPGGCFANYGLQKYGTKCVPCKIKNCAHCNADINKCDPDGCMPGYVVTYGKTNCYACSRHCLQCDRRSLQCLSGQCELNYFRAPNGSCNLLACPERYTMNDEEGQCTACIQFCKRCDEEKASCDYGHCDRYFFLTPTGKCLQECPKRYFAVRRTWTCDACPLNCLSCDVNGVRCDEGQCEIDYKLDAKTGLCHRDCPPNCDSCLADITICDYGMCQDGFEMNHETRQCDNVCPDHCLSCKKNESRCDKDQCQPGYELSMSGFCFGQQALLDDPSRIGLMVATVLVALIAITVISLAAVWWARHRRELLVQMSYNFMSATQIPDNLLSTSKTPINYDPQKTSTPSYVREPETTPKSISMQTASDYRDSRKLTARLAGL